MPVKYVLLSILGWLFFNSDIFAQILINEGSNRNYLTLPDEDSEYPDWVEIYNAGSDTINLNNYSLTDNMDNPDKWVFPNIKIAPGDFKTVFCSGKDRKPISGFIQVVDTGIFSPVVGWNIHEFTTPFSWDGISNIMINTCSYSNVGYTTNSVFNQTATPFLSTVFSYQDGNDAACYAGYGTPVYQRPNMKINGIQIGTGTVQNSPYDYPAPYGNWYWGARNQMFILASEMQEAGLTPGEITSLGFDVVSTDTNTIYDNIKIHMKLVSVSGVSSSFEPVNPYNYLHTNFKISETGETVYLFSPDQVLLSSMFINCNNLDNSIGSYPDGSSDTYFFETPTPFASNITSSIYTEYLSAPAISIPSGFYNFPVNVTISNPNNGPTTVRYTLNGDDPTISSPVYTGTPLTLISSKVLKVRVFADEALPSPIVASTYFFDVQHSTPVLSVITDDDNLYGPSGIFDNWWTDWERAAYVEYFDSTHQIIFSQNAGIQVDGGAGGSRSHPQHSFRIELDDGVLGAGPIDYPLIPNRPNRTKYSKFYLRNGSNQYLSFPHKDATQVECMAGETNNYYAAWRPVSVYINGAYFGLYELREKFDLEYFETIEEAEPETIDLLSQSYWYGGALRAVEGNVDSFYVSYGNFLQLNISDTSYWTMADQYFDLTWYTDYIIGETWMGNTDWPWNNIKIYRSDKTDFRWRFCLIDLELAFMPGGWTDCYQDHIQYMFSQSPSIPCINIWLRSIQNERFRYYFINRFADIMNTTYMFNRLSAINGNFYDLMVTEMPNEYQRWGDPNNIEQQMQNFYDNHLTFQDQFFQRNAQVRNHIQSNFFLPNQVNVTLDVYPEDAGKVKISTITPESYPWQGIYFNGIPVRIEAIPNEGYYFLNWAENSLITDTLNPVFLDVLNLESVVFKAFFEPVTTFSETTSINDQAFTLFPNPADKQLYLINGKPETDNLYFKISDIRGVTFLEGNLDGSAQKTSINIESIPASVYFLEVFNSKDRLAIIRFVKSY